MEIISGTKIAAQIRESLRQANEKEGIRPVLAVIVVGDNQENLVYVGLKEKAVASIGGETRLIVMPENSSKQDVINTIKELNQDSSVDGILLQLPMPGHLEEDKEEILSAIKLEKDVDGFTPVNRGLLAGEGAWFVSGAALACLEVIDQVYPQLQGKRIALAGDSFDVIIPLATIVLRRGYPVSIYPHYQEGLVNQADILVVEKGGPGIIKGTDIKGSPLIIDAGFYWEAGHSCGNVKRDSVESNEGYLLPVPGGLGPMLIAKLCENLSRAARQRGVTGEIIMKEYLSVSQLNNYINRLLIGDTILQDFWLKGEISGFRLYQQSGHAYFTLKDEESAVSCVMFKSRARHLNFKPEDGMEVLIRGSIAVYARQGKYQIYAEEMQPYGIGELFLYLEQLKNRLKAQGYFDSEKKKPIPVPVNRVGVVTSQDGAAFQDILRVLRQRHPGVEIILVHSSVQGVDAPLELSAGIKILNEQATADVIIVGRGGGSFEDLMAFNSEEVVKAIYESKLPVISAVGHEVDYCLADLAADLRAATPTQAAQLAVSDMLHLQAGIDDYQQRLLRATSNRINQYSETLDRVMMRRIWREPEIVLGKSQETLIALQNEMLDAVLENWKVKEREFSVIITALDKLSPLKVLSRGYAVVRQGDKIVRQVEEVTPGSSLQIDLSDGIVEATVVNRERVERWKR